MEKTSENKPTVVRELTVEEIQQISGGAMSGGLDIQLSDFNAVAWPKILLPKVVKEFTEVLVQR